MWQVGCNKRVGRASPFCALDEKPCRKGSSQDVIEACVGLCFVGVDVVAKVFGRNEVTLAMGNRQGPAATGRRHLCVGPAAA